MKTYSLRGFSLIEIITTLSIIAILTAIAVPAYHQYITRAERLAAATSLSRLAIALEQYYTINNTYKNASLDNLNVSQTKHYQLIIASATDTDFTITAEPLNHNDTACGTLILNAKGDKNITGSGNSEECWT